MEFSSIQTLIIYASLEISMHSNYYFDSLLKTCMITNSLTVMSTAKGYTGNYRPANKTNKNVPASSEDQHKKQKQKTRKKTVSVSVPTKETSFNQQSREHKEFVAFRHSLWSDKPLIGKVLKTEELNTTIHWWIGRYIGEWKECSKKEMMDRCTLRVKQFLTAASCTDLCGMPQNCPKKLYQQLRLRTSVS